MSDDFDTLGLGDGPGIGPDPLGIIGWEIGGKYIIRSHIGGGGFGEVYEGYNKNLSDQRLVFKFFKRVQSRDKFAKEAKILCMLDHPNISRVIDYLPEEGAVVVAFIDGKDGAHVLKESGRLSADLFLKVARGISSAVAYAHGKKIAHRDLKPGNIMFANNGQIYLIDFGIAKEIGGNATKTGYIALTPMFAAPERQSGLQDYNPFLSDVYELGITLFNFATNDLPYRNPANPNFDDWGGVASKKLSPQLRQVLMKATHPDPHRRYKSCDDFADELKSLDDPFGSKAKRKSYLPYIGIAALLVVIALAWGPISSLWSSKSPAGEITSESQVPKEKPASGTTATGQKPATETSVKKVEPPVVKKDQPPVKEEVKPSVTPTTPPKQETVVSQQKPPAKEETQVAVIPKEEVKPAAIKPTVAETPIPVAMTFDIIPSGKVVLYVDGRMGRADSTYNVLPGTHDVSVVHQDFPVYRKTVTIAREPRNVRINLLQESAMKDSVNMQIALSPPSNEHIIELGFNGRRNTLTEFPVLNMVKPKGEWLLEAGIFGLGKKEAGTPRIDSLVTFPHGGGPHAVIPGSSGRMKLGTVGKSGTESVPLLIFWSLKK